MLQTTRGIVFNQVKYSETSVIAKIYTEEFGMQSYLVRGARKSKAKIKSAHLQHLTLVELEVNKRDSKDIQHLKGLKIAYPFQSIPFNIKKSSVIVFLNEVLYKTIKEEESNPELFNFLFNAIQFLDLTEESIAFFHHFFLIQLTRFLGFFPRSNFSEQNKYFDLQEGEFTSMQGPGSLFADLSLSDYLNQLILVNFEEIGSIKGNSQLRNELLEVLINYFRLHIPGISGFKSFEVLKEVFGE